MSPHQKIKRAALNRTGLRLSADEAYALYFMDVAIQQCADNDDGWNGKLPQHGTYSQQMQNSRTKP